MYIRENGFKSHVWKITGIFRDDLGTSKDNRSKESAEGHGRP